MPNLKLFLSRWYDWTYDKFWVSSIMSKWQLSRAFCHKSFDSNDLTHFDKPAFLTVCHTEKRWCQWVCDFEVLQLSLEGWVVRSCEKNGEKKFRKIGSGVHHCFWKNPADFLFKAYFGMIFEYKYFQISCLNLNKIKVNKY